MSIYLEQVRKAMEKAGMSASDVDKYTSKYIQVSGKNNPNTQWSQSDINTAVKTSISQAYRSNNQSRDASNQAYTNYLDTAKKRSAVVSSEDAINTVQNIANDVNNIQQYQQQQPTTITIPQIQTFEDNNNFTDIPVYQQQYINDLKDRVQEVEQTIVQLQRIANQDPELDPRVKELRDALEDEIRLKEKEYNTIRSSAHDVLYKFGGYRFQAESAYATDNIINQSKMLEINELTADYNTKIEKVKQAIREENYKKIEQAYKELRDVRSTLYKTIDGAVKEQRNRVKQLWDNYKTQTTIAKTQQQMMFDLAESYARNAAASNYIPTQQELIQAGIDPQTFAGFYQKYKYEYAQKDAQIANTWDTIRSRRLGDQIDAERLKLYASSIASQNAKRNFDMQMAAKKYQLDLQKYALNAQKVKQDIASKQNKWEVLIPTLAGAGFTADEIKQLQSIDKNGGATAKIWEEIRTKYENDNEFKQAIDQQAEIDMSALQQNKYGLQSLIDYTIKDLGMVQGTLSGFSKDAAKEAVYDSINKMLESGAITPLQAQVFSKYADDIAGYIKNAQSWKADTAIMAGSVAINPMYGNAVNAFRSSSKQPIDLTHIEDELADILTPDVVKENILTNNMRQLIKQFRLFSAK